MIKKFITMFAICTFLLSVDVMAGEIFWLSPDGSGEIYSVVDLDFSDMEPKANDVSFSWIDPHKGTFMEGYYQIESSSLSPSWRIDTNWQTVASGAIPLLSLSGNMDFGVHSSSSGAGIQMRVVRSPWGDPLQIVHDTVTVNPGTRFTAQIGRGNIFAVQARVTSGSSNVVFTMR